MTEKLSSSAQRVQDALQAFGLTCRVVEMPQTTRTAEDAARAVGCTAGQIEWKVEGFSIGDFGFNWDLSS
ncbi:MAG: hypothetical protein WBM69_13675 [Desulfobacterales bacterium]